MTATPTISISGGLVSNVAMSGTSSTALWTYTWNVSSTVATDVSITVSGTDLAGNAYSGTDSLTFSVSLPDTTPPTVVLTDSDIDNSVISGDSVVVTATFSEAMFATPTISISGGLVSNAAMSSTSSAALWTYTWNVSSTVATDVSITVSGTDLAGNAYSGTDSLTFSILQCSLSINLSSSASSTFCESDTVVFTATSSDTIVLYDYFINGILINGASLSNQFTNNQGILTNGDVISVIGLDANGCSALASQTIIFNAVLGGTISTTSLTLCSNESIPSIEVNSSQASGVISYQWQNSFDGVNYTNILGAANPSYSSSSGISTNTFYRRILTSTFNGVSCDAVLFLFF